MGQKSGFKYNIYTGQYTYMEKIKDASVLELRYRHFGWATYFCQLYIVQRIVPLSWW